MSSEVLCRDGSTTEDLIQYETISWWIEGVIQIVINIIGIIANCIAIPVLLSRKLTNVFNRTLAILAIFDAIFNMCDILESVRMFHGGECRSAHVYLFPHVLYPLQNITMVASIYTTCVVAVERYLAVTRPISAFVDDGHGKWKKVLAFTLPVLVFSIIFNIPTFFEFRVETINVPVQHVEHCANKEMAKTTETIFEIGNSSNPGVLDNSNDLNPNTSFVFNSDTLDIYPMVNYTEMRVNEQYVLYYINWARNIITGILPIVSLIIFNQLVYKKLVKRRNLWKQDSAQAQTQHTRIKSENRQAHTLFGVVALFLIGHLFRMILNLHEIFMNRSPETYEEINGTCGSNNNITMISTTTGTYLDPFNNVTSDHTNGCIDPNRDCAFRLKLWLLLAKTISRFLLAVSFSGNLVIYCITSNVFRKVLWQQILSVYYTFCPSRNPNNRRDDMDASFGVTDITRIENRIENRRSPTPGKSRNQQIPMVTINKSNGMLDTIETDVI